MSEANTPGDDDDQLRAMRAVWLSMRDSDAEPPARGMAELLAAARAHAQEMQPEREREPVWRRWLAAMVRPPVLAFATVVVLAGTAAVVKTRGGMKSDEAPAAAMAPAPSPPLPASTSAAAPSGGAMTEGRAAAVPAAEPRAVAAPAAHTVRLSAAPHAPMKSAPPAMAHLEKEAPRAPNTAAHDAAEPSDELAAASASAPAPAPEPRRAYAKPPPPPSNDQLLRECQAAAARGDCVAVRAFAERMRAQDAGFYRDTFARDEGIAKCLPAPAPLPVAQ